MAIIDDDMKEVSFSLDSLNTDPIEGALLPADLAWADSCLNKDMGASTMDWSSMKDALMDILSSQTEPLNSSVTKSTGHSTDCEFLLPSKYVKNLGFNIRSDEGENCLVDDIGVLGDAESIKVSEDDEEGFVLGKQNGRVRGGSRLYDVFQPNYVEDIGKMEHLGFGLDLGLTTFEVDHSSEEIFKVWDLGISNELHMFSELNEAFAEVPRIQDNDSASWTDSTNACVDDLIAGVGLLSLNQHTKSHGYLS